MEKFETVATPESREVLLERLSALKAEAMRLRELSVSSGENIDVEFDSEEYEDHGYMAEARRIEEEEIRPIENRLSELDDIAVAQRNLPL